jgi:hypothetical protein
MRRMLLTVSIRFSECCSLLHSKTSTFGDAFGPGAGKVALGAGHRYEDTYVYKPGAIASFGDRFDMPDIFADSSRD